MAVLIAVASGALLTGAASDRGDGAKSEGERGREVDLSGLEPRNGSPPSSSRLAQALDRGIDEAHRLGGTAQAAVWAEGWPEPVERGDDLRRPMRLWSLAKPVVAVATLDAVRRSGAPSPSPELARAMTGALTRSENCRQRRVLLGLQALSGGPLGAREPIRRVLASAGAREVVLPQRPTPPEPTCRAYLGHSGAGLADPYAPTLPFGTARWTARDAVAFGHALGNGSYGDAGGEVIDLMRQAKGRSRELQSAGEYTADVRWGAGRSLARRRPAYKAGWGGSLTGAFSASQLALIDVRGRHVAIFASFQPRVQPPRDDPGATDAPTAIEAIFGHVGEELSSG